MQRLCLQSCLWNLIMNFWTSQWICKLWNQVQHICVKSYLKLTVMAGLTKQSYHVTYFTKCKFAFPVFYNLILSSFLLFNYLLLQLCSLSIWVLFLGQLFLRSFVHYLQVAFFWRFLHVEDIKLQFPNDFITFCQLIWKIMVKIRI